MIFFISYHIIACILCLSFIPYSTSLFCYCLSMRLVFIFHFQKKTASLLLTCFLIKKKKNTSTLSVVHTTLSVVYIIYSVSCKHLPCRLYTPQGQLCASFNRSVVNICSVGQLCTLFTRSVVNIYPVVCTHHKVSCVHHLIGQL